MTAPQPAKMLPAEIQDQTIELPQKPGARIAVSMVESTQPDAQKTMVVFLNGLMTNKSSWLPVMADIVRQRKGTTAGIPSMLAYDRYGQGLTESTDPQDQGREQGHGHDCADAAADLHQLIAQLIGDAQYGVILVANSIGGAIARLYARDQPVAAVLLLDSVMANSNFDVFPNPDAPDFDRTQLPEDVTTDTLREVRAKFLGIFQPGTPNKEGLSRRNLPTLLPLSDGPMLKGPAGHPWVTVVGHDFETFAEESVRVSILLNQAVGTGTDDTQIMGMPKSLAMQYLNPVWQRYNEGLVKLTDPKFSKGPFQAKGCGHFIQLDDPHLVVDEVLDLVDKV